VNDVSASLYEVAAAHGAGWVAMHMRGTPATMQQQASYDDVVAEVRAFLVDRAEKAIANYIKALQLSQHASVDDVPADKRGDLDKPITPAGEEHKKPEKSEKAE